jgi:nitrate/TMAO reductase-like tetraheme cytochrome c subunit
MGWPAVAEALDLYSTATTGPRWGTALDWAITLTLVLSALIIVGILVSWILYWGRQTEPSALWLNLLTLAIFPLMLLAVGTFATLEYSAEVRLCASCHRTMRPYIEDLRDAKSPSLAAAHYQDRFSPDTECYACHADYGLYGTFKAKATGLRHVYKYWTRTYHLPLKIVPEYDNRLCLKCHEMARRFRAQPVHMDDAGQGVSPDFLTGQTDCTQCHGPAHELRGRTAARTAKRG